MSYCDVNRVRLVSGIDSDDINDADLRKLRDDVATPELNSDVQQVVKNERVRHISGVKENQINGSNKTFYLRELDDSFVQLGDLNDDGVVDTSDVNFVLVDEDNDTRTDLTVVSIDDYDEGEFTVEKSNGDAVKGEDGYIEVSYAFSPVSMNDPDARVETACAQLTAAYAFTNIEASKLKNYSIGDVSINRQSEGYSIMRARYMETMRAINQRETIQTGNNVNSTRGAFRRNTRVGGDV